MSRLTETLATIVGVAYLFIGLAIFPAPVMFLMFVPKKELVSTSFLMNLSVLTLIFGPCLLIGYAWIRKRRWGRYLLIAYNGVGLMYFIYAFAERITNDVTSHLGWVIAAFLTILTLLGSLIAFALQEDVRSLMTH